MDENANAVDSRVDEISEQPSEEEEKTCMPCLLPGIMTAWATTRAVCEFLPDPESKAKCRSQLEEEAKDIKSVKSAESVMLRAIENSEDPEAFIEASIKFAQQHNSANSAALLAWAAKQEAENKPISEKTMKIIRILRLEAGV
jgi:hypothetical protein